jgi:hypothetical protein
MNEKTIAHRWHPGDTVVLRYITARDGQVGTSWPCRVVADRAGLLALYIPPGVVYKDWSSSPSATEEHLVDKPWQSDMLRLMFPGRGHSIWLFWTGAGAERHFDSYYVNMEEPFRRTPIGLDTNDHALDIVVTPELRWSWKDADGFAEQVRRNVYSSEFTDEVRAEAERVIQSIESRESPFCDGWERWKPDPSWTIPQLPPTWNSEPPTLWHRRTWAYPSAR